MDFFDLLTMVGGLALFLYGMDVMGDGLAKTSGGKLEQILEKLTSTPIKAVLLGAGVTAVIQSSSATTVMVVGFVNSGIMKLSQAVGIIMGANVGTTITSWILSLTGIESENFFIQLLKPSSFAPILALIGIFMMMLTKDSKKKELAKYNIRVNAVAPGLIETDMGEYKNDAEREKVLNAISMKRMGKPEEVAKTVRFLASDDSSFMTGTILNVDGGRLV